ncbi:DUF58 domain-containing protein [Lentibacillus cibarius]|uniref:DUF58 domain-containing protein n=1 Tax=Lentibacillus cibarius TaxID=2583219 RepID=A0A549YI49_9BACI|nr:DUF58 domain-containing protein [Lentibacillus cibarius]TRM11552.1 DUF58 domain-containing protein [Lentibacillus cibarius]
MKATFRFAGKLAFVIFLFSLLFSFAMFQGGFVSWFLFFGFLPIFLYHLGLLFYPIQKWEVTRELCRHVIHAGDRVAVTIRVRRTVPFPLYYCICEEVFPETLQKVGGDHEHYRYLDRPDKLHVNRTIKKIIFPGFRRTIELPYVIEQVPRGTHTLDAIRIRTGDVFGMITKEHVFHTTNQLTAFPLERPVHFPEKVASYEQGAAPSRVINAKNSNVAAGIREYTPGDQFSWIDWKQTAKKNTLITKEFEQEKSTDTVVVLDACQYPGLNELAFEAAVELTMSLLGAMEKQACQAGFLSIGERTNYFPLTQPFKRDWVNRHLTSIRPGGDLSFSVKLREEMMQLTTGATIVLVTTHMDASFMDVVRQVGQRMKKLMIVFIQASSLITQREQTIIRQLRSEGICMNVLTEKELSRRMIEVTLA